jgi:hypothetical protein
MTSHRTTTKPCPTWCTGTHDLITPYGECVHATAPVPLMVGDEVMQIYIESYAANGCQDPLPGEITWDFTGAATPSLSAREAQGLVAIFGGLINRLAKASYAPL